MSEIATEQSRIAADALRRKEEGEMVHHPESSDHADTGMVSTPFTDQAPSGALHAEGQLPARKRGEAR